MSRQRVTQENIWCHLWEPYLGSLLSTQVSALSDLLRITTVVLFTPPDTVYPGSDSRRQWAGQVYVSRYRSIVVLSTLWFSRLIVPLSEEWGPVFTGQRLKCELAFECVRLAAPSASAFKLCSHLQSTQTWPEQKLQVSAAKLKLMLGRTK
jgi:hypothetical protein